MSKKDLKIFRNHLLKAYEIRCIENKFLDLFRSGDIRGTIHTCKGQELLPVIFQEHLKKLQKYLSPDINLKKFL